MKHNLRAACKECPYVGNVPGWIGGHDDPAEFVEMARHDRPFPCHMQIDYTDPHWEVRVAQGQAEQCVGQIAFMNKSGKRSIDPAVTNHQDIVGKSVEVLWPPEHLIAVHRAGLVKGAAMRDAARKQAKKAKRK